MAEQIEQSAEQSAERTASIVCGIGGGRRIVGFVGSVALTRDKSDGSAIIRIGGIVHPDTGREQSTLRASNRTDASASVRLTGSDATAFLAAIGAGDDDKSRAEALAAWHALAAGDFAGDRFTVVTLPATADATGGRVRAAVDADAVAARLAAALA